MQGIAATGRLTKDGPIINGEVIGRFFFSNEPTRDGDDVFSVAEMVDLTLTKVVKDV